MLAVRRICLESALLVLGVVGCNQEQPAEPVQAGSSGAAGPTVQAPSNTNAVAVSETRIDVSWRDNSNETGFEVHRSAAGASGAFALLISTGAGVTSYSDAGLTPSTQYCYKVRAFRTTGSTTSYSQFSLPACATTLASEPPVAPSGLNADVIPHRIDLFWSDNSNNEDGWKIERCRGVVCSDVDFTVIATKAPNYPWYWDNDVEPGTTYSYRVRAFNSAGDSAPSNQLSATACFVGVSEDGWYVCIG